MLSIQTEAKPRKATMRRRPELPGDTAEAMFLELGQKNHARFVLRLLQAEMRGVPVRRLGWQDKLEEPPPAGPWILIMDDRYDQGPTGFSSEQTLRWLFAAADQISIVEGDPHPEFSDRSVEQSLVGRGILLILTSLRSFEDWLWQIERLNQEPNNPRPTHSVFVEVRKNR